MTRQEGRVLIAGLLIAFGLAGCAVPGMQLRDDYMFQRWFERTLFQREVTHDEFGNPVLQDQIGADEAP